MNAEGKLVYTLIDRLSAKLPYRSGLDISDITNDELILLTRTALVEVSKSSIKVVVEALAALLETLHKQQDSSRRHIDLIARSESYVVELLADCCEAHWQRVLETSSEQRDGASHDSGTLRDSASSLSDATTIGNGEDKGRWRHMYGEVANQVSLPSQDDGVARHTLDALVRLLGPAYEEDRAGNLHIRAANELDRNAFRIIEYLSASNWSLVFTYLQNKLRILRSLTNQGGSLSTSQGESEIEALIGLQVLAHLWINMRKLSIVIHELCGCFYNLKKNAQNTIAIVVPDTIMRWIEDNPTEFATLHHNQKRLEGGPETLFDMAITMAENSKRRPIAWGLQSSLTLLIPEAFWMAGNTRESRSGNVVKKAAFLEGLRKSIRSSKSKEAAAACLVRICHASRRFLPEHDTALLNFAQDVKHDLDDEIFKRQASYEDFFMDQNLMINAFASLCELSQEQVIGNVLAKCFASNAPLQFKIAVFSGCALLGRRPDATRYQSIFNAVAGDLRNYLESAASMRVKVTHANGSQPSIKPTPQEENNSLDLLLSVLGFVCARPSILFESTPKDPEEYSKVFDHVIGAVVFCLVDENETVRLLTSTFCQTLVEDGSIFRVYGSKSKTLERQADFWRSTSRVLSTLARKLTDVDLPLSGLKTILDFVHAYLEMRLKFLQSKDTENFSGILVEVPERSAATADMEIAFLVLLCSSDLGICSTTTSCMSLMCEEGRLSENMDDLNRSSLTFMRNFEVYSELSSQNFRMTGQVAFQKRFRKLLGRVAHPTEGILHAWNAVFARWTSICSQILSNRANTTLSPDDKTLIEWRNYSGFLAALGGSCISDLAADGKEDAATLNLHWIDTPPDDGGPTLLEQFTALCLQLLTCQNILVREATREVLGTELNPRLFTQLFKSLEIECRKVLDTSSDGNLTDQRIVLAEQAGSLLRTIIERLDDTGDTFFSVDLGSLVLDLIKYMDSIKPDVVTLRIRIKMCQLAEVVARKKEVLNLRQDARIRNHLLQIICKWMSSPGSAKTESSFIGAPARRDEMIRLHRDLDRACLKSMVNLMFRLQLQPRETHPDTDSFEVKSNLYRNYFDSLVTLLTHETSEAEKRKDVLANSGGRDESPIEELIILALSNLLSANIEIGLKHSLEIAYHENIEIRTAFMVVLSKILLQGTEFERLGEHAISEKYDRLLELLVGNMKLTLILCDSCPSTEVDELTIALLNIFDSRGMGFTLLKALIEHEVENTENESELLRRNCVATKMLSAYAKWKGADYLKYTLSKVLRRLMESSNDLDLELDPDRVASVDDLPSNAVQLRVVVNVFIDAIINAADHLPVSFRKICHVIATSVDSRFPESKYIAVGSFIFLRFFGPAIVSPETEGLVSQPPSKDLRRGLLLIAKVLQSLANNVPFGAKESFMYPMNDFLHDNIIRVTDFLRRISILPTIEEPVIKQESFDFGSCVALHRFLYEHWEKVRQRLIVQERRSRKGSVLTEAAPTSRQITNSTSGFAELIPTLGAPPMDITWHRPQISSNVPVAYSRFQHFMLKNAGKNTEAIVSAKVVYDGGETKDALPVICVILRNIDLENMNQDLLVYCFFKIASRIWHKPFGLFIDATCYSPGNELNEEMIRKMNELSPSEMSKNLTRIYQYNINSSFRKFFRRAIRTVVKDDAHIFHPNNVRFEALGSLPELQNHFHLGALHLPRETISLFTESRFTFPNVTRVSKTKGEVEVTVKVGSQHLQITTAQKQDLIPNTRLSSTINDIFKLSEVEEATGSMPENWENAFGIKAEGGKIIMYFSYPRRADVLQSIRTAKAKLMSDVKPSKPVERTIRPEDVPGTLLNICLMNLAHGDENLRLAAYNLLCSLCKAFKFSLSREFITTNGLSMPINLVDTVVDLSERMALSEPKLTYDFLTEFFVGWNRTPTIQRSLQLLYMRPWLPNLRIHLMTPDNDVDKGRERLVIIAKKLLEVSSYDEELIPVFQKSVWSMVAGDEVFVEILLDELTKSAIASGFSSQNTENMAVVAASLNSVIVRGKIISRLRKVLNRTSLRPTRRLMDNSVWGEICVLLRICVSMSFGCTSQPQLFLPELFHIITMMANRGPSTVRSYVHKLLVNTVHSMCTSFPLDEANLTKLKSIMASLSEPKVGVLFSLHSATSRDGVHQEQRGFDGASFTSMETITTLLLEIMAVSAPSVDMANAWRARWMSLVASTSFQSNPAIQPRAFAVMGCLAKDDVDDDLLYQVLVALRSGIAQFRDNDDSEMLIAIITGLTKMMDKLPASSRYVLNLYWLALSFIRMANPALYSCSALFLEAVLQVLAASGDFKDGRMVSVLLQGRLAVEEPASELDDEHGICFDSDNFHLATCISLAKGLSDPNTRPAALHTLSTFLEVASTNAAEGRRFPKDDTILPYLSLVTARANNIEELKEILWLAGVSPQTTDDCRGDIYNVVEIEKLERNDLMLNAALCVVDFRSCDEAAQQRILNFLERIAKVKPAILIPLVTPIGAMLDEILMQSQSQSMLKAANSVVSEMSKEPRFSANAGKSTEYLSQILDDAGCNGWWRTGRFANSRETERKYAKLVDRLVEHIIA